MMSKSKQIPFVLILLGCLIAFMANDFSWNRDTSSRVSDFQKQLNQVQRNAITTLEKIKQTERNEDIDLLANQNTSADFFIEEDGKLTYWSSHKVNPLRIYENGIYHFANGWYELIVHGDSSKRWYATIPLKREFRYENEYLKPHINPVFQNTGDWKIQTDSTDNSFPVFSFDEESKVYLEQLNTPINFSGWDYFYLFFGFVLIGIGCLRWKGSFWTRLLLISIVFQLFAWNLPASEFYWQLGGFRADGGQIIAFLLTVLFVSLGVKTRRVSEWISYSLIVVSLAFIVFTNQLGIDILSDATLELDFDYILNFKLESWASYITLVLSFIVTGVLSVLSVRLAKNDKQVLILYAVGVTIIAASIGSPILLLWLVPSLAEFVLRREILSNTLSIRFLQLVSIATLLSTFSLQELRDKEQDFLNEHIQVHANERDLLVENLMANIQSELVADERLGALLDDPWTNYEAIERYLNKYYFNAYWSKFVIRPTGFQKGDSMIVEPSGTLVDCEEYFSEVINVWGKQVSDRLFFIDNPEGITAYICDMEFGEDKKLIIELDSRVQEKGLGFPELLTDQSDKQKQFLPKYSYAKYSDGQLIDAYGSHVFSTALKKDLISDTLVSVHRDHHYYVAQTFGDAKTMVVVKEEQVFNQWVTYFSYLLFILIIVSCTLFLIWFLAQQEASFRFSFKNRLQVSMVTILVGSFVIIGAVTVSYLVNQFRDNNEQALKEKIKSVQIEVQHKLGAEERLSLNLQDYTQELMIKFSKVFFADINVYDLNGRLMASSQPKLFSEGLTSSMIHPEAYRQIRHQNQSLFIHEEAIGSLNYLSAYVPFFNDQNELLGVLNLPYFSKQSELQEQINQYLVSILNVYVLLTIIAIAISLFIYHQITRPLRMVQERFKAISLEKTNELIEWNRDDELGDLIQDYNRLIVELSDSAEQLAQSEREGAWKEMARQVAHEIKNPLTPMKLSIQHLQRSGLTDSPEDQERLKKVCNNLIEQIDHLTSIANEFSNFARMPDPEFEELDLVKQVKGVCDLYAREKMVSLTFSSDLETAPVLADKNHVMRIMSNLLKNAVQATYKVENARIHVTLKEEVNHYLVTVQDNGVGISEENKKYIFNPKFTTKNSGSGLGLAMVKSMVNIAGGDINFESEEGEGSRFYVRMRK